MGLNQWADNRADEGQGPGERSGPRHGRAALLRLATWFEEAEPDRADALAAAVYALNPALHLEGRVDDGVAATTSWWQADADRSTVTERPGTRLPELVRDHRSQQARLRDAAESSAHWRRAGAAQIRALLTEPTGDRACLDLSGAGMEVLMELLTAALGSGDASRGATSAGDLEFALRLHVSAEPGAVVIIQGEGGDLTLEGLRLRVTPYEQPVPGAGEPVEPSDRADPAEPSKVGDRAGPAEHAEASGAAVPADTAAPGSHGGQGSEIPPVEDPAHAGSLPGPDPDTETTGPIDISTHQPRDQVWG